MYILCDLLYYSHFDGTLPFKVILGNNLKKDMTRESRIVMTARPSLAHREQ